MAVRLNGKDSSVTPNCLNFRRPQLTQPPIIRTLKGIVYYSNQVVAINNSGLKDKEKNQHLARYLSNIIEQSIEKGSVDSMGMDMESLNKILQDIPQQKTYLDGIATASPIINGVVRTMQERLDRVQEIVAEILALFDRMVYDEFAMTRINYISLKKLQMRSMRAVTMIYDGIMGEPASLDSLFIMDRSLQKFFQKDKKITIERLIAAEKYLLERLDRIDHMITQMDDDIIEYHAKQDEMENWRLYVDEKITIARNAMTVWAQSHRNLGAGIPVPPLIDVAGIATGLVGTATGVVLP